MKSNADPRHTSRKLALASIFSWLFSEANAEECVELSKENLIEDDSEFDKELQDYIVLGVKEHREAVDGIIQDCAPEWPLDKISETDLVILRIAVFEIVFGKRAPTKVAIDEGIELAKEFGGDTSHKFINGVLGTVVDKYIGEKDK